MTIDDLIACVEREIGQRQRVYPRLVADGSVPQQTADLEIESMETVALVLKHLRRLFEVDDFLSDDFVTLYEDMRYQLWP